MLHRTSPCRALPIPHLVAWEAMHTTRARQAGLSFLASHIAALLASRAWTHFESLSHKRATIIFIYVQLTF